MSPTLVLLPGMDGTGELFGPFIEALGPAQPVQVLRYPAERPMDYAELVRWAGRQLPANGPYVLLGESFSGPVAWRLAAHAGERLKGLVLCCTFARNPMPALSPLAGWCRALPWRAVPEPWLAWAMLGRAAGPQARQAFRRALDQVPRRVLSARARAVLTLAEPPPALSPGLPVLCLSAQGDRIVPRAATRQIQHALPQARAVALPGPHGLLQANPAAAAAAVLAFVRRIEPHAPTSGVQELVTIHQPNGRPAPQAEPHWP